MAVSGSFHHRGDYGTLDETLNEPLQPDTATAQLNGDHEPFQLGTLESTDTLHSEDPGSGWIGASFNLTSSIVGAGCIGLGGAIANSGGLISLATIAIFGILCKYSFDLVVDLAMETSHLDAKTTTYESLGYATYGDAGRTTVIVSKGLYSFGCMVAYIVIVKDNFSFALAHLIYGSDAENQGGSNAASLLGRALTNQYFVTIFFSTSVMLPLCMLRDLTPLERFSALKITVVMLIVAIVMYLFVMSDKQEPDVVKHWLVVYGGVFESLGTFVFAFAAHNVIHLVFQSLKRSEQRNFYRTTTLGTLLSTVISVSMGFFLYMTFWENTSSAMFQLYPPSTAVAMCRTFLCISMLLTYPFPLFTVRELLVLTICANRKCGTDEQSKEGTDALVESAFLDERESWLLPGSDRQLKRKYHMGLTCLIWLVTLILALGASSLGSVLNLTGCATGTVISYILPAMFSYQVRGHTILGSTLFLVGGSIGLVGTYYSILALF